LPSSSTQRRNMPVSAVLFRMLNTMRVYFKPRMLKRNILRPVVLLIREPFPRLRDHGEL